MTTRPHDPNSVACWCGPIVYRLCSECDGDGCWCCQGKAPWPGLIPAPPCEAENEQTPCVIVHQVPEELPPATVMRDVVLAMQADLRAGDA